MTFNPRRRRPVAALLGAALAAWIVPANAELRAQPDETTLSGSYLAARFAGSLRDLDAAADYYREALALDAESPQILERAFLLILASGDVEESLALARKLVALDGSHRLARLALGVEAVKARQYAEAQKNFEKADQGPLADLTATLLSAWAMQGAGDTDGALAAIDGLEGPEWYKLFQEHHAGMIAEIAGRNEQAGRRYANAYRIDNTALRIVDSYIRFEARHGSEAEAKHALDSVAAPDNPLLAEVSAALASGAKPAPAAGSVGAGAAEVLYGIGAALAREGGEDVAAVYLRLALHIEPKQPLALYALGDLHNGLQQREQAIALYDSVPPESPLRRMAQIQTALALDGLDRTDEALQRLELLIESDATNVEAITAMGNILRARERFEESAAAYGRAIEQIGEPQRGHWTLFYFRGIAYERSKQWAKGEADLKKALELYPEQPLVLNYLGYSWVDQGLNLDEALGMIRRAVELRPEDGYIVDSLGWAHYRLGRFDEAVKELERAVELRPQDAVINDHLGDAYWMVGRRLEARFQWSHARDLDPEPEDLVKIVGKLKDGLRADEPNAAEAQ